MKHKRGLFCFYALFIISIVSTISFSCINSSKIDFGKICWRKTAGFNNEILDSNGKTLVGPGYITLWGKYPHAYGDIVLIDKSISYFIIDLRDYKVTFFKDFNMMKAQYGLNVSPNKFVTFQDLLGQWSSTAKLNELRSLLR